MADDSAPGPVPGRALLGFLLALTLLKGIRMPNRWAVTHYLFTYQSGFMKRGLWGEALRRLLGGWTANYFVLAAIGLAMFAAVVVLLVALCARLAPTPLRGPLLLVLLSSPALAFAAHLAGYLEQLGYIAVLLIGLQRRWRTRVVLALASAAFLPLVHEASVVWVGAPSLLGVLVGPSDGQPSPAARLRAAAAVAGVWIAVTAAVLAFGGVSPERANALRETATTYFEIRPRQDAYETLSTTLGESLDRMKVWWAKPVNQRDIAFSILVFFPAMTFLAVSAVQLARRLDSPPPIRRVAVGLVLAAIVAPLLLHVIAWDMQRWNAQAALNAGLAGLFLLGAPGTRPPAGHAAAERRRLAAAAIIAAWGIAADPALFDDYAAQHPPFAYHVRFLVEAIRHPDRNLWIPLQGN